MVSTPVAILVTGGTGFIGRHLLVMHVARGYRVRALTQAVESPPPQGTRRIVEVPEIRRAQLD
jgi:uncharacterized protein YbjT (DUF2867 family)